MRKPQLRRAPVCRPLRKPTVARKASWTHASQARLRPTRLARPKHRLKAMRRAKWLPTPMCRQPRKRSAGQRQALRLTLRRRTSTWDPSSALRPSPKPTRNQRRKPTGKRMPTRTREQIRKQRRNRRRRRRPSPSRRRTALRRREWRITRAALRLCLRTRCRGWAVAQETR